MPCRTWLPFALLALVTLRAVDLWQAGDLDPISLALVPIGAAIVVWLVRQPGCDGAACAVPDTDTAAEPATGEDVEPVADAADPGGAARR